MSNRFLTGLLALSLVALGAACGGDDNSADADLTPDGPPPSGTISLTWTITNGVDTITCADANAQLVVLDLVRQGEGAGQTWPPNCTAGEDMMAFKIGTYDISIDLVDSSANSVLDAPIQKNGIEVMEGLNTSLGEIVFTVGG